MSYRLVRSVPSADAKQPKYPLVLLNADGSDWLASTANVEEAVPAFERMIAMGEASEIVEVSS